jgi:hypothetical protein
VLLNYQRKSNPNPSGQFHPTGGSKNSSFGVKRGIIVPDEYERKRQQRAEMSQAALA